MKYEKLADILCVTNFDVAFYVLKHAFPLVLEFDSRLDFKYSAEAT